MRLERLAVAARKADNSRPCSRAADAHGSTAAQNLSSDDVESQ